MIINDDEEAGVFLSFNDCTALYPRLKENEPFLSREERQVLFKIEQVLYKSFSIDEMEELLEKASSRSDIVKA